ncbi:porin [Acetonema longum]|uniref:Porin domain-containing protein n=1 Tax=Acetonema longum DSM 6540 TaxID=1009370 RepID=F7NMI9_9FIRM|nr:porin [Acetonema longum]EGO62729.1 hypothetical protein ALO_16597 [Acetonema longum DSM 6540]
MKHGKTLLMAALLTLGTAAGVHAEEGDALEISGSLTGNWEHVEEKATDEEFDNTEQTFNLNLNYSFSDKLEAYLRYSYRHFGGDNSDEKISELDLYGIKYQLNEENALNIGSQEAELGVLSGLVDLTEVGKDAMMQGVTWDYGAEDADISAHVIGGETFDGDLTLAGLQLNKKMGDVTVSGEYLHLKDDTTDDKLSTFGLGAAYTFEKWGLAAEYLRSDADEDKTGYLAGVTYSFTDDNTLSLTYRNLKSASTLIGTYGNDTKGFELEWEKSFSDRWTLTLTHEKATTISTDEDTDTSTVEVSYSF